MVYPSISILDNDFYKFTMQRGVIRLFTEEKVQCRFITRGNMPAGGIKMEDCKDERGGTRYH